MHYSMTFGAPQNSVWILLIEDGCWIWIHRSGVKRWQRSEIGWFLVIVTMSFLPHISETHGRVIPVLAYRWPLIANQWTIVQMSDFALEMYLKTTWTHRVVLGSAILTIWGNRLPQRHQHPRIWLGYISKWKYSPVQFSFDTPVNLQLVCMPVWTRWAISWPLLCAVYACFLSEAGHLMDWGQGKLPWNTKVSLPAQTYTC